MPKITTFRCNRVDNGPNYIYWLEVINVDSGIGTGQFITIETDRSVYIPMGKPIIIDMNPE